MALHRRKLELVDLLTRRAIILAVAALVGYYDLWAVRSAGPGFQWRYDLEGFYNFISRGLLGGHLYMPFEPSPKLLALPNPWDPTVGNDYKIFDLALYNGHYYLYHGVVPAVLLFVPWRLVTKHDLPETFAVFLFAFGGFLFACGTFLRILSIARVQIGPALLGVSLLALGVCQSVPSVHPRLCI